MSNRILIHAWPIYKKDEFYLPYVNWVYLKEIVKYYDQVTLLSPEITISDSIKMKGLHKISCFKNVTIETLPEAQSYISNARYFYHYLKSYNQLFKSGYDVIYSRYPSPFGWLQRFFGSNKTYRIIHYVGEPLDTIKKNPNISKFKKNLYAFFFKFEDLMFDIASKHADKVYTNGSHISDKLIKRSINATPVISSTLNDKDFYFEDNKIFNTNALRFVYVGFLNKAKGIEVVLEAFRVFQLTYPLSTFTIVGKGELEEKINRIIADKNIQNVILTGHIDERYKLLNVLRNNDIFIFGSFSEGSPRVILEAMANGLVVVTTPVGSLPTIFEDKKDLLFAEFNSPTDFESKFELLASDINLLNTIRTNSYRKSKDFTVKSFLKNIFDIESKS